MKQKAVKIYYPVQKELCQKFVIETQGFQCQVMKWILWSSFFHFIILRWKKTRMIKKVIVRKKRIFCQNNLMNEGSSRGWGEGEGGEVGKKHEWNSTFNEIMCEFPDFSC